MKRNVVLFVLCAILVMVTVVCAADGKREIKIAYSIDTIDETQQIAVDMAEKRVKELNEERDDIHLELTVYDAQNSVDKQITDVQTAIITQPDVLIFSAVDTVGSLPAAEAAKEAGILLIDRRPSDPEPEVYDVAFHANNEGPYTAATKSWIEDYLAANPETNLKIGLIYGNPAQTPQLARCDIVKELAAEMPDRIEIVAEGYGNWNTVEAQNLAQDWLLSRPGMNFIVCANDIMALGASNAVIGADMVGKVMISGYDLTDDGVQRIVEGTQTLDVGVNLKDTYQIIDVAVAMVLGEFKDSVYMMEPTYKIDASNVQEYLDAMK